MLIVSQAPAALLEYLLTLQRRRSQPRATISVLRRPRRDRRRRQLHAGKTRGSVPAPRGSLSHAVTALRDNHGRSEPDAERIGRDPRDRRSDRHIHDLECGRGDGRRLGRRRPGARPARRPSSPRARLTRRRRPLRLSPSLRPRRPSGTSRSTSPRRRRPTPVATFPIASPDSCRRLAIPMAPTCKSA